MTTAGSTKKYDETRIAEEIVSGLPAGVARVCSADRNSIRYAVLAPGLPLRSIVLSRASLRRLAEDPERAVKIEYLQRDLATTRAAEFRYPRPKVAPLPAPSLHARLAMAR
ncbi:MAG TPA: hypothetical protein VFN10_20220 [Thermoanaerobaculia bacterium]|nr:hypothetical protein [Thermoanaerobaculia bacterium]